MKKNNYNKSYGNNSSNNINWFDIIMITGSIVKGGFDYYKKNNDMEKYNKTLLDKYNNEFKIISERYKHNSVDIYTNFLGRIKLNPYTFQEFIFDHKNNISYIKDEQNSYVVKFNEKVIINTSHIDFDSFKVLSDGYSKDNKYLYYDYKIIDGVDSTNIEIINLEGIIFIKNDKNAYRVKSNNETTGNKSIDFINNLEKIEGIDPTYFKVLKLKGKIFIKSKNKVHYINEYSSIKEIKGLSPFGFQVIDKIFIRDKWKIYGFIRESTRNSFALYKHFYGVNPDSFKVITSIEESNNKEFREGVFIDDKFVYTYNRYGLQNKFENISTTGFQLVKNNLVGGGLFKNLEKLFDIDINMGGLKQYYVDDINSFYHIKYDFFGDKNHIYFFGDIKLNKLEYIDRNSFKIIDLYYIKDKYGVFFCEGLSSSGRYIDGIYFNTPDGEYKLISRYPEAFEKIDNKYYKDLYNIYYNGKRIEYLDPNTFKFIEGNCYEDNNYYCIGEKVIEKNKYINYNYYLGDFLILHGVDKTYIKTKEETHELDITENKQLTFLSSGYFLGKENIYYFYSGNTTSERRKPATTSESGEWRSNTNYCENIKTIGFDSYEGRNLLIMYGKKDILDEYYKNKN